MISRETCTPPALLAEDTLRGAEEIAEYLFGDKSHRRKIYHLVETSRLPAFRLGSKLCARKSVLLAWISEQERAMATGKVTVARSER